MCLPEENRGEQGNNAGDNHKPGMTNEECWTLRLLCSPLPGHEVGGSGIKDAIGNEAKDDDGKAIHEDWMGKVRRAAGQGWED